MYIIYAMGCIHMQSNIHIFVNTLLYGHCIHICVYLYIDKRSYPAWERRWTPPKMARLSSASELEHVLHMKPLVGNTLVSHKPTGAFVAEKTWSVCFLGCWFSGWGEVLRVFLYNFFNALFGREPRREISIWQARIAQKLLSNIPQAGGWMGSSSPRRKCVTRKARDPLNPEKVFIDFWMFK